MVNKSININKTNNLFSCQFIENKYTELRHISESVPSHDLDFSLHFHNK